MALNLQAKVSLDGSGFDAGIKKIEASVQRASAGLKNLALSAFGIYGVERALKATYERADELITASRRLGIGIEPLQLLREAAVRSRSDLEALTRVLEKVNEARLKILSHQSGYERNLGAFQKLGVSQSDIQSLDASKLLMGPLRHSVTTMNQQISEPLLKMALGIKTVGEVIPILKTNFEELEGSMKRLGTIMDANTAVKLKYLGDELKLVGQILTTQLAPVIIDVVELFLKVAGKVKEVVAYLGGIKNNGDKYGGMAAFYGEHLKANAILGTADKPQDVSKLDPEWIAHLREVQADWENAKVVGGQAAQEVQGEWAKMIDGMRKRLSAEANALDNPPPPDFSQEVSPAKPKAHHPKALSAGDELISVGNFLGSNRNPLSLVAEKQLHVLKAIEHNTRSQGTRGATHPRMPHL